jgi:hypothetical protein
MARSIRHAANIIFSEESAMSKLAVVFLLLGLACLGAAIMAPAQPVIVGTALAIAAAVSSVLFLAALFIGRRIKFDPLLR